MCYTANCKSVTQMEVDQLTLQWVERDTNVKPRVRERTCNNCILYTDTAHTDVHCPSHSVSMLRII